MILNLQINLGFMKKRISFIFLILFFVLMRGMGEAFVPQAPHLLHLVVEKIKQPVGIEVFQSKKIMNDEGNEKEYIKLNEKLIYEYPNRIRSEIISDNITSFSVESDFRFIKVVDGAIVSQEKLLVDLYTDILFSRDYESFLNQINLAGIDTDKVTFQRYNDIICYVIGDPLSQGKPFSGLWIEKDTIFPIKYVVEKNGLMVEILYHNWQRVSRTWYPMKVSIFLDNQLFAMVEAGSIRLKSGASPSLFDIDYIKRLYPVNDIDPLDENSKQVNELDKRLEDFRKLYE